MKIELSKLYNNKQIEIDELISFEDLTGTKIKKLEGIKVSGLVKYNLSDEIELNLNVKGTMMLEDSITLDDIPYEFDFFIEETLEENNPEIEKYFKNNKNILDINEILWENIVLEVPISYTKNEGANLKGDGWELNGDKQESESPFAKLNDLFKGGE